MMSPKSSGNEMTSYCSNELGLLTRKLSAIDGRACTPCAALYLSERGTHLLWVPARGPSFLTPRLSLRKEKRFAHIHRSTVVWFHSEKPAFRGGSTTLRPTQTNAAAAAAESGLVIRVSHSQRPLNNSRSSLELLLQWRMTALHRTASESREQGLELRQVRGGNARSAEDRAAV